MLVYRKSTGIIVAKIPKGQPYNYIYDGEDLGTYDINSHIDFEKYLIINDELVELSNLEILEIKEHGRILSEEERLEKELLNKLKPSYDEIKKAEQTIELLELFQEVL